MAANREIELYLSGSKATGLLLYGHYGMPLKEEGLSIAASLLETNKERLEVHPDFLLLERGKDEKTLGVDSLQELFSKAALKPALGDIMVILIHNMDAMTEQAQNKLLKTLEDNTNVRIIATANDIDKVLPTIKSRVRQIHFYPMTQRKFKEWCEESPYTFSEELYIITHGCPGVIEAYLEVVDIFKEIKNAYEDIKVETIFSILHLLKEKDSESYHTCYPQLIFNLWEYLGFLVKNSLIQEKTFHRQCNYTTRQLQNAISVVSTQMAACKQNSYQKDVFFLGIVNFVESLKGGLNNGK